MEPADSGQHSTSSEGTSTYKQRVLILVKATCLTPFWRIHQAARALFRQIGGQLLLRTD